MQDKDTIEHCRDSENLIQTIIIRHIAVETDVFVFPTQVTASMWAEKALFFSGCKALPSQRFIAWDIFKSSAIRSVKQQKSSIPSAARKLFAEKIIDKNQMLVKEGQTLFTSLIPQEYAQYSHSFSDWIASLLPQLYSWKEKLKNHTQDAEDQDLMRLEKEYSVFLDKNNMFEPAWERPPFHNNGNNYYVFFPEILQDYTEYAQILQDSNNVHCITVPPKEQFKEKLCAFSYENTREEIRKTALHIHHLHEKEQIPYTSIALHVPGIEEIYPYITREFSLRGIPYQLRAGKTLTSYPSGTLFRLIQTCITDSFSFSSIKQLLVNRAFPWESNIQKELDRLIQYGIKNNCLCSYETNGCLIDIWEESFKTDPNTTVARFYRLFKDLTRNFTTAQTFSDIRNAYFTFRSRFFDMDLCTEEADLVLSRCITELINLSDLETSFPDLIPQNPFAFFCTYLDSCEYLPQNYLRGVHIFPYKTAAAAPFDHNIVINAGQKYISVQYKPLNFLSKRKRDNLKICDSNVSNAFAVLYSLSNIRFSCSAKTFTGWSLPHSVFTPQTDLSEYHDTFLLEKNIFAKARGIPKTTQPAYLHTVQKEGFLKWQNPLPPVMKPISLDPGSYKKVMNYITHKETGLIRISSTILKKYFFCPLYWIYDTIFALNPITLEANLLDDVFIGTIYHAILNLFFSFYKEQDKPLPPVEQNSVDSEAQTILNRSIHSIIQDFPDSCFAREKINPLTVQIVKSQEKTFTKNLTSFLKSFLDYFAGATIVSTEKKYDIQGQTYMLTGVIDLVLKTKEQELWIIDFKTGMNPKKTECIASENRQLSNFQLALYVSLYEKNTTSKINGAAFFSILKNEISPLIGLIQNQTTGKNKPYSKKAIILRNPLDEDMNDFNDTLEVLDEYILNFVYDIQSNSFTPYTDIPYSACFSCKFKNICRTTYTVAGDKTAMRAPVQKTIKHKGGK